MSSNRPDNDAWHVNGKKKQYQKEGNNHSSAANASKETKNALTAWLLFLSHKAMASLFYSWDTVHYSMVVATAYLQEARGCQLFSIHVQQYVMALKIIFNFHSPTNHFRCSLCWQGLQMFYQVISFSSMSKSMKWKMNWVCSKHGPNQGI